MIWHIFKKDLKLLWPFVAAVTGLWWAASLVLLRIGFGLGLDPTLTELAIWLPIIAMFCSLFLVVAIVQTEPIPGVRHDWLVRPIARRDLLLEKLLFACTAVSGPLFTANLFEELSHGFSVRSSLIASGWEALFFCVFLVLPLFALASVTQNMTEAFIFGGVCAVIFGFLFMLSDQVDRSMRGMLMPVPYSGIGWVGVVLRVTLAVIGTGAILLVQYFRRRTPSSRVLLGAFASLVLCIQLLPWRSAFAVEEHFSKQPTAGLSTTIGFDPNGSKFAPPSGAAPAFGNYDRFSGEQDVRVFLPLRVDGVNNDSILLSDYVELRISGQSGHPIFHGIGQRMEVNRGEESSSRTLPYQEIALPMTFYTYAKDRPVQIRANYSLTLFRLAQSFAMPALNGAERMPALGACQTRLNNVGTAVMIRCMEAEMPPVCVRAVLDNPETGAQNPGRPSCNSEYEAYRVPPLPDALGRLMINIPFRDALGLAKYPVDGPQLAQSKIVIQVYEPVDHFTRTMTVPNIRLGDWVAE